MVKTLTTCLRVWVEKCLATKWTYLYEFGQSFLLKRDPFTCNENQVITYIHGILVEFVVSDLNEILGIAYSGLKIFTSQKELEFARFNHSNAVRNFCRKSVSLMSFVTSQFALNLCFFEFGSCILYCNMLLARERAT